MKPEIKKLWVAALRSGEYKQGEGQLRDDNNRFCCLGVLCNLHAQAHPEIAAKQNDPTLYMNTQGFLPYTVAKWAGLGYSGSYLHEYGNVVVTIDGDEDTLSEHNDCGHTFEEIADAIEAQL